MSNNAFGLTSTGSTSSQVTFVAIDDEALAPIVGHMVYFDTEIAGEFYRSIGTVTDITTENPNFNSTYETILAKGTDLKRTSRDLRRSGFSIQATFKKNADSLWEKYSSSLPTSPSTNTKVNLLTEHIANEMISSVVYPTIGYFRGMEKASQPITLPDFGGKVGASHNAVIGKSGSGKDLALDTPIPTPAGWTTMGELKDGDIVLDETGKPVKVLKVHEILTNSLCYEVSFSDGSKITAGAGHLWFTETEASRKSKSQDKSWRNNNNLRIPFYSHEITSSIRKLADECQPEETITVNDVNRIISEFTKKNSETITKSAASSLPVIDHTNIINVKPYTVKALNKEKTLNVFSSDDVTEAVSTLLEKNHQHVSTLTLDEITSSTKEYFTRKELSFSFGYPKRSEVREKVLKNLPMTPYLRKVSCEVPPITYNPTIASLKRSIPLYNKKQLLNAIAERGSRLVNDQQDYCKIGSVKTTQEIFDTLTCENENRKTWNHSIPVAQAIVLPDAKLPIHPYTLGAWLGDSFSAHGSICGIDDEICEYILEKDITRILTGHKEEWQEASTQPLKIWTFSDLQKDLIKIGLLKSYVNPTQNYTKFIPSIYLRSSIEQRKELLAGLMDTDGNTTKSSSVEFTSTSKTLAYNVHELALSLGYRATITEENSSQYDITYGSKWIIRWSTTDDVFKLLRKRKTHFKYKTNSNKSKNNQRYIVAITEVDTVPTRCITVDSSNALYLAGRNFIPTHNTSMFTMILGSYMQHEQHAIVVIDPQGQWSNENGMIFSPQNFAKGLGRQVNVLRVSEDIKLPMDVDIFTRMLTKIKLWKKFRRMGSENLEAFSDAVASRIAKHHNFDLNPRDLLSSVFVDIANSPSAMARIYTKGDRRDDFRRELLVLAGEPVIDEETGEEEILSSAELEDNESNWENILSLFTPLINLFSSKNFEGGQRKPLGGKYGFLKDIFKIRSLTSDPAPYVVLDMSPNLKTHAKNDLIGGTDLNLYMQQILDDQDVKALILMMMLTEMKKASEIAFAAGEGNLNTQIVFDEAWRFAPEGKASPEIEELAKILEGFALDTRKFGIGWSYILQSPADLKFGIWKQLTYVFAGYGLVGDDVKRLEALTDDTKQINLYRQFIPPASTGIYPFMLMGPISPIIFTTSPAFVNVFSSTEEFLEHNNRWIQTILSKRQLPEITEEFMQKSIKITPKFENKGNISTSFKTGSSNNITKSEPQTVVTANQPVITKSINKPVNPEEPVIDDLPF